MCLKNWNNYISVDFPKNSVIFFSVFGISPLFLNKIFLLIFVGFPSFSCPFTSILSSIFPRFYFYTFVRFCRFWSTIFRIFTLFCSFFRHFLNSFFADFSLFSGPFFPSFPFFVPYFCRFFAIIIDYRYFPPSISAPFSCPFLHNCFASIFSLIFILKFFARFSDFHKFFDQFLFVRIFRNFSLIYT